ncbi:hypothetical protein ES705_38201 [subsurface metagenome]
MVETETRLRVVFRLEDSAIWTLMRVHPHRKLLVVWSWILRRLEEKGCREVVWSSFHRPKVPGESGIHDTDPCRSLDWYPVGWSLEETQEFEEETNLNWVYGKDNPKTGKPYQVIMWHDVGRGPHFHTQVRDETHGYLEEP